MVQCADIDFCAAQAGVPEWPAAHAEPLWAEHYLERLWGDGVAVQVRVGVAMEPGMRNVRAAGAA